MNYQSSRNNRQRPQRANNSGGPSNGGQSNNNNNAGRKPQNRNNRYKNQNYQQKRRYNNSSTNKFSLSLDVLVRKYYNLLDQHLIARKKYFEFFYKADPNQKNKLERLYSQSMKLLREFESRLTPEQQAVLSSNFIDYKLDNAYSQNHEIPESELVSPPPAEETIEDPHVLMTQIQCDFKDDTEESVGTLDDYNAYKGIS